MNIPPHIFKSYDIRGVFPDEINTDNISHITHGILSFFQKKAGKKNVSVIFGRDMRISSPILYPIIIKTLKDGGAHIIDIGLSATPTMYFAVLQEKADAGIQLTASHNPSHYNGIKIVMRDDKKIIKIGSDTGMQDIKKSVLENITEKNIGGSYVKRSGIVEEEIKNAFKIISSEGINPLTVVVDAGNAMAALYIEPLFKKLPCKLIKMNFKLDGTFPSHQPDPLIFDNFKDLYKRVVSEKADLGIAPDGDGDRIFFVDENGKMIPASMITALIAKELLALYPKEHFLFDIRYIMTPKSIIEENGGTYGITKVGHSFITKQLQDENGIFGGESSGHMFYRATGGAESQIASILIVLKALSESGLSLSDIIEKNRRSYESGEYNFKTDASEKILKELKKKYSDADLSLLDGVSIQYSDWRCNVRTSNTEPLLRLNVEAKNQEIMTKKLQEIKILILKCGAVLQKA